MLYFALVLLVFALIASVLGFTGIVGTFAIIGKVLFGVFLMLLIVSLVFSGVQRSMR